MANYCKYRKKEHRGRLKWFVVMVFLIVIMVYSAVYTEKIVKPAMNSIAKVKAQAIVVQTVNDSIHEEFLADTDIQKLLNLKTDQDGVVTYVEANTKAMNELAAGLTIATQERFNSMKPQKMKVPVGSLLGSPILSQVGPNVNLKIMPVGVSYISFRTEFESCGINQTKYKVYLDFESEAKVLIPFSQDDIKINDTVLVAEAIIVGRVPETYVQVPKEQITDALDISK